MKNNVGTRLQDLETISSPVELESRAGIKVYDVLRVFSGDGPARQFEAGQQRGGNYSCICGIPAIEHGNLVRCYGMEPLSLNDRCNVFMSPSSLNLLQQSILNPYQNLKKQQLIQELHHRSIDTSNMLRSELQETLANQLHGIVRPPALMIPNPLKSTEEIHIPQYEILGFEPLHDVSNVIQNLILELPNHILNKSAQKEFQHFSETTIGEKNQIKGSDARLFLVKLAKFADNFKRENKIEDSVMQLINSLVEIVNICYSRYETRCPKQVLRLYNQCFLFAILCRIVIGSPSKMSSRKFFGSHFHSLTVHLPEALRLFNLRTIVTEQEERCFGQLRKISENTSNRQAEKICDNAVLRFTSQQSYKEDYLSVQESIIRKQAQLLKSRPNSIIPLNIVQKRPMLLQAHLQRISDFMLPGEGIRWHSDINGIVFHDAGDEPSSRPQGPKLSHYRSSSLKIEHQKLKEVWETVTVKFEKREIILPLKRIKDFNDDGEPFFREPEQENTEGEMCMLPYTDDSYDGTTASPESTKGRPSSTIDKSIVLQQNENDFNMDIKLKYFSYIKDKSAEPTDEAPVQKEIRTAAWCMSLPNCEFEEDNRKKPSKRRLSFDENYQRPKKDKRDGDQESDDNPFMPDSEDHQPEEPNIEESSPAKLSTTELIEKLLGSTDEVATFQKYRRILTQHPWDNSIRTKYDKAKAVVGFKILHHHSQMKINKDSNTNLQQQIEALLKRWNISIDHLRL